MQRIKMGFPNNNAITIHSNDPEGLVWNGAGEFLSSPHIEGGTTQEHYQTSISIG